MSFTKDDTWMAKGIAILMMYWHHFFLPERVVYPTNFFPFSEELGVYIASFCKICVGMFAFLSAYGMTVGTKGKYRDLDLSGKEYVRTTFRRWFSLMKGWTFVFIICQLITFFIDKRPLQVYGGGVKGIFYFILDYMGLAYLFDNPQLIGTWWYMSLAIGIILLFPLILKLYKKFDILLVVAYPFFFRVLNFEVNDTTRWYYAAILGVVCADKDLLYKIKKFLLKEKDSLSDHFLRSFMATVLLVFLIVFRQAQVGWRFAVFLNGIVPAYVILFVYVYLSNFKVLKKILVFLGHHSMNMFLTHSFLRAIYLTEFSYSFKYAILDIIVMVIITVIISLTIEGLKHVLKYEKYCKIVYQYMASRLDKNFIGEYTHNEG